MTDRSRSITSSIRKVRQRAAGIDIGATEHWVCVDPELSAQPIRCFGGFTDDLVRLVGWLKDVGVETVAMEATGVYWRELYTRLEESGLEVMLVDPRRTRNPRGRKTDMQDCQWIWDLHSCGLLDGSYVPGPIVQKLRTYLRFRATRVEQAGVALKEMQRSLSLMNIKLQHVISDIGGETGQAIITAILAGERNPKTLAKLRNYRCKQSEEIITRSLTGTWRREHVFLLRQAHDDYRHHHAAIAECDRAIAELIQALPAASDNPPAGDRKRSTGKNEFHFDAQQSVIHLTGIDMAAVDGIGPTTAMQLLGEIGFNLTPWPSSKAFCCWMGLCPNPKRSGGKHLGNLPTSANRAARILRNAAMGLDGKKGELADFFRKMASRRGRAEAIKATAHKLARIIYALFRDRCSFDREKLKRVMTPKAQRRRIEWLRQQAQHFGMSLTPQKEAECGC